MSAENNHRLSENFSYWFNKLAKKKPIKEDLPRKSGIGDIEGIIVSHREVTAYLESFNEWSKESLTRFHNTLGLLVDYHLLSQNRKAIIDPWGNPGNYNIYFVVDESLKKKKLKEKIDNLSDAEIEKLLGSIND